MSRVLWDCEWTLAHLKVVKTGLHCSHSKAMQSRGRAWLWESKAFRLSESLSPGESGGTSLGLSFLEHQTVPRINEKKKKSR